METVRTSQLTIQTYKSRSTFFFSSRRRHTSYIGDWSSDVCSSDLVPLLGNGDGTFTAGAAVNFPPYTSQGIFIRGVKVADVNGDGKAGLLIVGAQLSSTPEQFPLYEALGNGDGTFQTSKLLFNNLGPFFVA